MIIPTKPVSKNKNKKVYFPKEAEDAIVEYNSTDDSKLRSKIYEEKIYYAFFKLTENIIHTFKFHHTDGETIHDFQQEIMFMLLEKMNKFDPKKDVNKKIAEILKEDKDEFTDFIDFIGDRISINQSDIEDYAKTLKPTKSRSIINKINLITPPKAYSYFGTIVKRYCIIATKSNYKKKLEKVPIDELDQKFDNGSDINYEKLYDFMNQYVEYCIENIYEIFPDDVEDVKIADAILQLFKERDDLFIFNKKALYIHIREKINVKTSKITDVAKVLKKIFETSYTYYLEYNIIKFSTKFNIYNK